MDEQLKEYILEWRKQRAKEEDELKKLKDKQAKRKVSRAEEEKRMAQRKKEEEERRVREVEEKKQREIEEKRQRLEEAEKKRQAMLQAQRDKDKKGPNFTIQKKEGGVSIKFILCETHCFGITELMISLFNSWVSQAPPWNVTRPRNNLKKKRKSPFLSALSLWTLTALVSTNSVPRPKNFGKLLSDLKLKSMI